MKLSGKRGLDASDYSRVKRPRPSDSVLATAIKESRERRTARYDELSSALSAKRPVFELEQGYVDALKTGREDARVQSAGRVNPEFIQGFVTAVVKQGLTPFEDRAATPEHKRVIPLGTKPCYDIVPGDVLMMALQPRGFVPRTLNGDTSLVVTSTPCGLDGEARYQFVGIARTINSSTGGDGQGEHSTGQIGGIGTTINTGWGVIPAFSPVIVTMTPYAITEASTGAVVPGIEERGQPADKFQFGLQALDERTVPTILARTRREISALCDTAYKAALGATSPAAALAPYFKEFNAYVDTKKGRMKFAADCPWAVYAFWYCAERAVQIMMAGAMAVAGMTPRSSNFTKFIDDGKLRLPESTDDKEFYEAHGLAAGSIDTRGDAKIRAFLEEKKSNPATFLKLMEWCTDERDKANAACQRTMRMNYAGMSIGWSNVGAELNILMGQRG